jgi:hypothetical protein
MASTKRTTTVTSTSGRTTSDSGSPETGNNLGTRTTRGLDFEQIINFIEKNNNHFNRTRIESVGGLIFNSDPIYIAKGGLKIPITLSEEIPYVIWTSGSKQLIDEQA